MGDLNDLSFLRILSGAVAKKRFLKSGNAGGSNPVHGFSLFSLLPQFLGISFLM